ncbi:MAG TPA: DUF2182 domain-containing protein [Rubrobacteraceae bacterium]|nr:DUF2182 domain-containing protein [Rubrobacteraceae bacterium]
MQQASSFSPAVLQRWRRRENLLPGLTLLALAAAGWAYTVRRATEMDNMGGAMPPVATGDIGGFAAFVFGWTAMMVAMMVPATLPMILLYRTISRKRLGLAPARAGVSFLLAGYIGVWAAVGLPVYVGFLLGEPLGSAGALLPGLLLVAGGVYQFTGLKKSCHARCANPLFFLMRQWRPGAGGALRLGTLHGADCLGCCAGVMLALVALGMMNLAWMLTAAVVIFIEKTIGSHRIARPLGVAMVAAGLALLGASWLDTTPPGMGLM